jgi:hypothetical protein
MKASCVQFTLRNNYLHDNVWTNAAIGGNMNAVSPNTVNGTICFNRTTDPSRPALNINNFSNAGAIFIYRNTLMGDIEIENAEPENGPFVFSDNVIVNETSGTPAESHIRHFPGLSDPSRVVISPDPNGNLTGYGVDGLVDAVGQLQGIYRDEFLGDKGFEVEPAPAGQITPGSTTLAFAGAAPRMNLGLFPSTP